MALSSLTHHSEPCDERSSPPLSPSGSLAFAILLKEKSISNTENKSNRTRGAAFHLKKISFAGLGHEL